DPIDAEAVPVARQGHACGCIPRRPDGVLRLDVDPALVALQQVVLREREEVVPMVAVPRDDHLGEIGTVAPERMRVEVAFPSDRGSLRGAGCPWRTHARGDHERRGEPQPGTPTIVCTLPRHRCRAEGGRGHRACCAWTFSSMSSAALNVALGLIAAAVRSRSGM